MRLLVFKGLPDMAEDEQGGLWQRTFEGGQRHWRPGSPAPLALAPCVAEYEGYTCDGPAGHDDAHGCWAAQRRVLWHGRAPAPPLTPAVAMPERLCWQGLCYSHGPHTWQEDKPGGEVYYCKGASTDRT